MKRKKENPLMSILANILLPVVILNKSHLFPGENKAVLALVLALSFPIGYGLWDKFTNKKVNYISLLGLVNTLITGFFAIAQLQGIWFAVKEAAFPFVLGIATLSTSFLKKPFMKTFLGESGLLKMDVIESAVKEKGSEKKLFQAFNKANVLFSISFFISAVLNFILAVIIFRPISTDISSEERAIILNKQISSMTWQGMLVISVPLMIFLGITMAVLLKSLQKATDLTQEELVNV